MSEWLYTYACHEDESELCALELRTLFGVAPEGGVVLSPLAIDPSRSPFVKLRLACLAAADSLEAIAARAALEELDGATFKIVFVDTDGTVPYDERRACERAVGAGMRGRAEMRAPQRLFGLTRTRGRWRFGELAYNEAVWLRHHGKPRQYSTALSARMARAVVNIAVPEPAGARALDPCCGIGTVLLEARSMGVAMDGSDRNPLAVQGARENLRHFGLPDTVGLADMRSLDGEYDALVLDLPYNLCSRLSAAERGELLTCAARLADRAVIIATEPIEGELPAAGLRRTDGCVVRKGRFARYVTVAQSERRSANEIAAASGGSWTAGRNAALRAATASKTGEGGRGESGEGESHV